MDVTSLIFVLIGAPVVFCVLTYLVATAYRVYFPEMQPPIEQPPEAAPRRSFRTDEPVPVGVREIKEDQRRMMSILAASSYSFSHGFSSGLPSDWMDEVWRRRN
ncbi:MAG: hypothetical protein WD275_05760 [Rhodothermales bacterium]